MSIRIVIADDHPIVLDGLEHLFRLEPDLEVVARCVDGAEALNAVRELEPDILLLDLRMRGKNGLTVLRELGAEGSTTRVVLLTASESAEDLLAAVKAGASGYLTKDTPLPRLASAMRDVIDGGAAISPAMGGKLFSALRDLLRHSGSKSLRSPELTGREIEILGLVGRGKTSKEIAEELFISENTVRNHVRNILDKLGMKSRFEAVNWAIREGLIDVR